MSYPVPTGTNQLKGAITPQLTLLTKLCQFVLTCNCFRFGDNLFLLINGIAKDIHREPPYAKIFMADLE